MRNRIKDPSRFKLVSEFMRRGAELHSGYDFGSHGTVAEQAEFGRNIIEYFQESAHGGWEGFRDSFRGMSQIMHLIADIERFIQCKDPETDDKKTDEDIAFVDEYVQEYARLHGDAGDPTRDANWKVLQHLDAIRCSIDPDKLRKSIAIVEADENIYREQTS